MILYRRFYSIASRKYAIPCVINRIAAERIDEDEDDPDFLDWQDSAKGLMQQQLDEARAYQSTTSGTQS